MATSTSTDGGEEPDYRAVSRFTFHDKHSGHSFKGVRYLNSDDEWDTTMWATDNDETPTVAPAPEFIQRRWDAFTHHRKAAERELDRLIDKVRSGRECPICGESMTRTRNEWVIQQATGCPDYATSDNVVHFCPECETNVHYDTDSMNSKSVRVLAGHGFDGPSFGLSKSYGSLDKRQRYRSIETPDQYQEPLTSFHKRRVAAQAELGYLPDGVTVNTVTCDQCGDTTKDSLAHHVSEDNRNQYPEGVYCSHTCSEQARDAATAYVARQGAHAAKSYDGEPPVFGPYDDKDTARQKVEALKADPDYVDTGWVTGEMLPENIPE